MVGATSPSARLALQPLNHLSPVAQDADLATVRLATFARNRDEPTVGRNVEVSDARRAQESFEQLLRDTEFEALLASHRHRHEARVGDADEKELLAVAPPARLDAGLAQEALRPAVENVVEKLADQADSFSSIQPPVAPAQIVGVNADAFYVDKGENYGVVVGQRYGVQRVVDEIRDGSGNLLDTITERVGVIEVTRVLGQSAVASVVEGEAADGDTLVPVP